MNYICIRTFFSGQQVRYSKGKWYHIQPPSEIESKHGVGGYINLNGISYMITKKQIKQHFSSCVEYRENRINQIID